MSWMPEFAASPQGDRSEWGKAPLALLKLRAGALHKIVRHRGRWTPLRFTGDGWRWLRYLSMTCAETQRAIAELIKAGAVTIQLQSCVLVAGPTGGEDCQ